MALDANQLMVTRVGVLMGLGAVEEDTRTARRDGRQHDVSMM